MALIGGARWIRGQVVQRFDVPAGRFVSGLLAEPLESRQYLTAVTLTGSAAATSFEIRLDTSAQNVDFYQNDPSLTQPSQVVPLNQLSAITIVGESGADTLTVDFSNGNPLPVGNQTTFQGAARGANGGNQLFIVGNGAAGNALTLGGGVATFSGGTVTNATLGYTNTEAVQLVHSGNNTDTLTLNQGTFVFDQDLANSDANLSVVVGTGATAEFAETQHLYLLDIFQGGLARMLPRGGQVLELSVLNDSGTLDLSNNDMIIHNGDEQGVTSLLHQGFDDGNWDGPGITSSTAADDGLTLGVSLNQGFLTPMLMSSMDGQPVVMTDLLVKYTEYGDLDLNGVVDGNDATIFATFFGGPGTWSQGDLNYDGVIDDDDQTYFGACFGNSALGTVTNATVGSPYTLSSSNYSPVSSPVRWDVSWGDGTIDSYDPYDFTHATHVYESTGMASVEVTAALTNGSVYTAALATVAVQTGSFTTQISFDPTSPTDINIALQNTTYTALVTQTAVSGNTAPTTSVVPLAQVLAFDVGGDTRNLTVDFSNGDPLPIGGLAFSGTGLKVIGDNQADLVLSSATGIEFQSAATSSAVIIRHNATATVQFEDTGGAGAIGVFSGTLSVSSTAPTSTVAADAGLGPLAFVLGGATLDFDGTQDLAGLTISAGATARLQEATNTTLVLGLLTLALPTNGSPGAVLDVTDNDVIVQQGSLTSLTGLLRGGYDGGNWDGGVTTTGVHIRTAIVSSVAQADPAHVEALGIGQVGVAGAPPAGTFDGQAVAAGDIIIKFTYYGDSNLDGNVDASDVTPTAAASPSGGWTQGDYNYDGFANSLDTALSNLTTGLPLSGGFLDGSVTSGIGSPINLPQITPAGQAIASWRANWGTGIGVQSFPSGTTEIPYASSGQYTAVLTALDASGSVIYEYPRIEVKVEITISGPSVIAEGSTATFTVTPPASDVDWIAMQGTSIVATGSGTSFAFTPDTPGQYTVNVNEPASPSGTAGASVTLTVTQLAPAVTISGQPVGFVGQSLTFESILDQSTVETGVLTYQWHLQNADGTTYIGSAVGTLSTYVVPATLQAGSYAVHLVLNDILNGITTSDTQTFNFEVLTDPDPNNLSIGTAPLPYYDESFHNGVAAEAITRQADGKYVVAVDTWIGLLGEQDTFNSPAALIRFNADLTIDTTFGPDHTGMVLASMGSPIGSSRIFSLSINPFNQDIIAVGDAGMSTYGRSNPEQMLSIEEYLSQPTVEPNGQMLLPGTPDPTFNPDINGNGQPKTFPSTTTLSVGYTAAVASDGSIYVGGTEWTFAQPSDALNEILNAYDEQGYFVPMVSDFLLIKLNPNGSMDAQFNGNGVAKAPGLSDLPAYTPFGSAPSDLSLSDGVWNLSNSTDTSTALRAIIPLESDKVLVAGYADHVFVDPPDEDTRTGDDVGFALIRYDSDGQIDSTFGNAGETFTSSQTLGGYSLPSGGVAFLEAVHETSSSIYAVGVVGGLGNSDDSYLTTHPVIAAYDLSGNLLDGMDGRQDYGVGGVVLEDSLTQVLGNLYDAGYSGDDEGHGLIFQPETGAACFLPDGDIVVSLSDSDAQWSFNTLRVSDGAVVGSSADGSGGTFSVPSLYQNFTLFQGYWSGDLVVDGNNVVGLGTLDDEATNNYLTTDYNHDLDMLAVVDYFTNPAPAATNLQTSAVAAGQVDLQWMNSGSGQDGFQIERSTVVGGVSSTTEVIATTGPTQDDFVDSTALADTTYSYQVIPFATIGGSMEIGTATAVQSIHTLPTPQDGYQLQEDINVPSSGNSATTVLDLVAGETYLFVASGTVNLGSGLEADAASWYSSEDDKTSGTTFWTTISSLYQSVTYGIAVGDVVGGPNLPSLAIPSWSSLPGAPHEYTLAYVGDGYPVEFQFDAAGYPSGLMDFSVQIYAKPRVVITPTPPIGATFTEQPTLSLSVPSAVEGPVYPVISTGAAVDVLAADQDGSQVPWQLWLKSPTGEQSLLTSSNSSSGTLPDGPTPQWTLHPAQYTSGVYTLVLKTTDVPAADSPTLQIMLAAPVLSIVTPDPASPGLSPTISNNLSLQVLAAAPDGTQVPWQLELISSSGSTTILASGNTSVGTLPHTPADVSTLDPAAFPNGLYTLELSTLYAAAQDDVNCEESIDIQTAAKIGALQLSATDGTVSTVVGPMSIGRSYNSSRIGQGIESQGYPFDQTLLPSFGPGWSFSLLDTQLHTTAQADTYDPSQILAQFPDTLGYSPPVELAQSTPVLRAGDLVYLTVPGDGQHVFEFAPTPLIPLLNYNGALTTDEFAPTFIALDGSGDTLTLNTQGARPTVLTYDKKDDEYLVINLTYVFGGFNPTRSYVNGGSTFHDALYCLTTKSGISYSIDPTNGFIESVADKSGNIVTYNYNSNGTITATDATQQVLMTINTSNNLISSVVIPGQSTIYYHYSNGYLTSVQTADGETTSYSYENGNTSPYLTAVMNSAGATILRAEYSPSTQFLSAIITAQGVSVPVTFADLGSDDSIETEVDPAGDITESLINEKFGTVDREIQVVTNQSVVEDYIVTVTSRSYVNEDLGTMSSLWTSGVDALRSVQSYSPFEVSGTNAASLSLSETPLQSSWVQQVVFDTSSDPDDAARQQVISSSTRIDAAGSLMTTHYGDYTITNQLLQLAMPEVTTVELQTPDSLSGTGYDDEVQSTTYLAYDSNGNETSSVVTIGRDVPGYGANVQMLAGGFPDELYVTFTNLSIGGDDGRVQTLNWIASGGMYVWSDHSGSDTVTFEVIDNSLSSRGNGATPEQGDSWTLWLYDADKINGGLVGQIMGQSFDGTPGELSSCVNTLINGSAGNVSNFANFTSGVAVAGSQGIGITVPGWDAEGTQNIYTPSSSYSDGSAPNGLVSETENITATVSAEGAVTTVSNPPTSWTVYYGTGDYTQSNGQEVPVHGASYGQERYGINSAGQETYYGYNETGENVLKYTYEEWTVPGGTQDFGWVGTTSVYDSAGRLTDTYAATYLAPSNGQGGNNTPTAYATVNNPFTLPMTGTGNSVQVDTNPSDSGSVSVYSAPRLTQQTDYNSLGQTIDTIDQYGGKTLYTYDANGNTIETQYPDGTQTLTVYDALNRAIWSTNQYDPGNLATAITTRTVYNSLGQATETQQYAGELVQLGTLAVGSSTTPRTFVSTTDGTPSGPPTTGTLISTTSTYYDAAGNAIETVSPSGLRTGTIYYPNGTVEYTGPLNASAPDGGRPVTTYAGVSSNAFSLSDFISYTETDPDQYDPTLGLFYTQTVDQNGHATKTYTDALGRTVRTVYADGSFTETLYSVGTQPVTLDAEGETIATPSDGWNTAADLSAGAYEQVNIAQRKAGDPPVITYDLYNAAGELTDVWQPAVADMNPNSPTYSLKPGNNGQFVEPHWTYLYDTAGNEIAQVSPAEQVAFHNWYTNGTNSGWVLSGGSYNPQTNVYTPGAWSFTPPSGVTWFGYDQNGNQVQQILPDGELESWTYNAQNQLASSIDFNGNTATYTYEANYTTTKGTDAGDLLSVVYAAPTSGPNSGKPSQTVTYSYNDLNQQASVTDASGVTTDTYDAEGDLTESQTPEGNIWYVFDPATGNHTETYTANTDVVYGYDNQSRLTSVTVDKLNGSTLSTPLVTRYTYDAAGNKLTETLPDGEVTTYTYDTLNRLKTVTEVQGSTTLFSQSFTLNDDGTRASAQQSQVQPDGSTVVTTTAWTYDADGRLSSEAIANAASAATPQGLVTTYALPAAYNPGFSGGGTVSLIWNGSAYLMSGMSASQIGVNNVNGEALLQPLAGAAYGGNGTDWVLVATTTTGVRKIESFTFANGTFTPDNAQTGFSSPPSFTIGAASGFQSGDVFSYDLDNNRTSDVHTGATPSANASTTYTYNGDDEQLTQSVIAGGSTTTTTNTYDANGSLESSVTGGITITYTYDVRNKMVGYASGTSSATYVYDDDGDRIGETVTNGGTTTTTLYLTDTQNPTEYDQPIEAKTSATATPTTTYLIGDHIFGQANGSGTVSYLLTDGHGSTQQTTSSTGNVTAAFRYEAFGIALNFNAIAASTHILFGGDAIYDPASGTYQHSNGRPSLGFLFTQMNPPGYSNTGDPISLHNYVYAGADTINGSDPSGDEDFANEGGDGDLADQAFDLSGAYTSDEIGGLSQVVQRLNGEAGIVFSAESLDTSLISAGLGSFGTQSAVSSSINTLSGWVGSPLLGAGLGVLGGGVETGLGLTLLGTGVGIPLGVFLTGKGALDTTLSIAALHHALAGDGVDSPGSVAEYAADKISGYTGANPTALRLAADCLDIFLTAGLSSTGESALAAKQFSELKPLVKDYIGLKGIGQEAIEKPLGGFFKAVESFSGCASDSYTVAQSLRLLINNLTGS